MVLVVCDTKTLFLAGIGAAALTYDKVNDMLSMLVQKGKLTVDDGIELTEELKKDVKETAVQAKDNMAQTINNIKPLTKEDLKEVLEDMNYATKVDIIQLQRCLENLEQN